MMVVIFYVFGMFDVVSPDPRPLCSRSWSTWYNASEACWDGRRGT